MSSIEDKQKREIEFWRDSPRESPQSNSVLNIINKMSDAAILYDCIQMFKNRINPTGKTLELGGGQGWGSCLFKRLFPKSFVIATDISQFAIESLPKWEYHWRVNIDKSYPCKSYETAEPDSSIHNLFCFASAHHFLAHRRTLREISRILAPGGTAFYFYEPVTPKYLYRVSFRRVNRRRPAVPEDVLITQKIKELALETGLKPEIHYYPSHVKRGPKETLYFTILRTFPFLQNILPATANIIFTPNGE